MSLLEDSSDDSEERRRQMEAREAAQNLGAVIGLAAGAVGAAARAAPKGHTQTGRATDETDAGVTPRLKNWKKGIRHNYGKYQAASNAKI